MANWIAASSIASLVLPLLGCAGGPILTPRLEDASAPGDYYRAFNPDALRCKHEVAILRAHEVGTRAYRELSSVSATCYPGAPNACRQTLSERACELEADAVIVDDAANSGTPPGASNQSAIESSGRAVKWEAKQE